MYILICFLIFMTGSCIGSFLHVCFSRTGWLTGRSRCDSCGYRLRWYDLIPVFSYIIYLGKCRKCKKKISLSHFVSEVMMGAGFLCSSFYFRNFGFEYGMIIFTGVSFMTAAAIQDYIERQIYTITLYSGIICTVVVRVIYLYLDEKYYEAIQFIGAAFMIKLLFMLFSELMSGKIGDGDFDLFVIMFSLCGGMGAIKALTIASIAGCVIYLPLIAIKKEAKNKELPFAPLLLFGTLVYLWYMVFK